MSRANHTKRGSGPAPTLDFMIIGAQKAGTTALARFLAEQPGICMANPKEVHVFDDPDFDTSRAAIDARYAASLSPSPEAGEASLHGEATPIYLFQPSIAARLAAYNPQLKLIILLREPTERAWSQFRMERVRNSLVTSFWWALVKEWLWLPAPTNAGDHWPWDSPQRTTCLRARGLYSGQIRRFLEYFPASQILIVDSEAVKMAHQSTLQVVLRFLGLDVEPAARAEEVFAGQQRNPGWLERLARTLLWVSYAAERRRLRSLIQRLPSHGSFSWLNTDD